MQCFCTGDITKSGIQSQSTLMAGLGSRIRTPGNFRDEASFEQRDT